MGDFTGCKNDFIIDGFITHETLKSGEEKKSAYENSKSWQVLEK